MSHSFHPFYEQIPDALPGPSSLLWKVCISIFLAAVFLAAQFRFIGDQIFHDWTWLLDVLIASAPLMLYYASHTLRDLFPHMDSRLPKSREQPAEQNYLTRVRMILRDRNFVIAGLFFGALNCVMGFVFGVPGNSVMGRIALFTGFFVVGFICGMAALGIFGVLHVIKAFMKASDLEKDYSAPDRCGGMLFLGEALVKFSSATLVMGVLIAIFIVNFPWTGRANVIVKAFMWFWIAFPFFLSLLVLLAPAAEINRVLSDYKVDEEDKMDSRLAILRIKIDDPNMPATDREAARKDYEYYAKVRSEIYEMRTWPFGISSSVQYATLFVTNAGAMVWKGVGKLIGL